MFTPFRFRTRPGHCPSILNATADEASVPPEPGAARGSLLALRRCRAGLECDADQHHRDPAYAAPSGVTQHGHGPRGHVRRRGGPRARVYFLRGPWAGRRIHRRPRMRSPRSPRPRRPTSSWTASTPTRRPTFDAQLQSFLVGYPSHGRAIRDSLGWGQTVADAVLNWRSTDGSNAIGVVYPRDRPGRLAADPARLPAGARPPVAPGDALRDDQRVAVPPPAPARVDQCRLCQRLQ